MINILLILLILLILSKVQFIIPVPSTIKQNQVMVSDQVSDQVPAYEKFVNKPVTRFTNYKRHAKLDDYYGIDYIDDKPPCFRGEYGCSIVNCPKVFNTDIVCWVCKETIAEPQYEDPSFLK
jgi:hypothetical protein